MLRLAPFGETPPLEPVHEGDEIRPLDSELFGDLALLLARLAADNGQNREFGRAQLQLGEAFDEVLEHAKCARRSL
jgi:hypothetical protein